MPTVWLAESNQAKNWYASNRNSGLASLYSSCAKFGTQERCQAWIDKHGRDCTPKEVEQQGLEGEDS